MCARRLPNALLLTDLFQLARKVRAVIDEHSGHAGDIDIDVSNILPLDCAFFVTAANLVHMLKAAGVSEVRFSVAKELKFTIDDFHSSLRSVSEGSPAETDHLERFELCRFSSAEPSIVQDFVGRFSDFLNTIPALIERFEGSLAELMENVYVHSNCQWGGYIYGYANKTEKLLRFSIADFGDGIPWTLKKVTPYDAGIDDDTMTYEASKYGITSKFGRAGSGLDYAASFAKGLNGVMRIYSRKGCLRINSDATCILEAPVEYPGTLVTIDLPLR